MKKIDMIKHSPDIAAVTDEWIFMRGLRFHYRDWPSTLPDAPVLLLLHGFTGHARMWDSFAQAMSDRYRVIALDQRGHGETQWAPADAYAPSELALDIQAFVQALGLKSFSLVGLSMGGRASMLYAGARPAELNKLVIVDIGPEMDPVGRARIEQGAKANDVFASRQAAFEQALKGNQLADREQLRHRLYHAMMLREDGLWTYRFDPALRDPARPLPRGNPDQLWKAIAHIHVPTLIIRGEQSDVLTKECAQRMASDIPAARLESIARSGHVVPVDQPLPFLETVRTFL